MTTATASRNGKTPSTPSAPEQMTVVVPGIQIKRVHLRLVGDSPLIVHRWSEKAKAMMLAKQTKQATQAKAAKDPHQDYLDSLYILPGGGYGFPAVGFKSAAVGACRFTDVKMTEARGAFHIEGELIPLEGEPQMREDMVRIAMGTADLRYRGEFREWAATLPIVFNARAISVEQIVGLFDIAGFGVGVGEWRPEKDGSNGRFHVDSLTDVR